MTITTHDQVTRPTTTPTPTTTTPDPTPRAPGRRFAYVAIGAHDGSTYEEDVRRHAQRGPVLLVEALPHLADRLTRRFADDPAITCIRAAVASVAETRTMFFIPDEAIDPTRDFHWLSQLGSFQADHATKLNHDQDIRAMAVDCVTPGEVLAAHGVAAIDLLMIDTEGADTEILLAFPWDDVPVTTTVFEHNHATRAQVAELVGAFEARGWRVRQIDDENAVIDDGTLSLEPEPFSKGHYPTNLEGIRLMRQAVAQNEPERAAQGAIYVLKAHQRNRQRLAKSGIAEHHYLTARLGHRDLVRPLRGLCREAFRCPVCEALRVMGMLA